MENINENQANTSAESVNIEKDIQSKAVENTQKINCKTTTIILAAALVLSLGFLGLYIWKDQNKPAPAATQDLTAQDATKLAIDYINKYYTTETARASAGEVGSEQVNGLYKFVIEMQGQKINSYVTANGKMLFPQDPIDLTKSPEEAAKAQEQSQATTTATTTVNSQPKQAADGNFTELTSAQVCQENGKPIVYFFGSESCPHCKWEQPVISAAAKKFGSAISYHENIDNGKEMDIFNQYSDGGVPTLVIGCKYYRIGSGESAGIESETATLTKLICNITGNQPGEVCGK
jgi:thiol-disulfide isomerase/thioredoxin